MITVRKRIYNEMGAGFDEVVLFADENGKDVSIIYVGKFADTDTYSTVWTGNMDKKGYVNG